MRAMFHTIAPRYDFITRAFSYGMDRRWKRVRRRARALAGPPRGARPGLRHRRFFAAGAAPVSRRARRRGGSHRAHAPAGAGCAASSAPSAAMPARFPFPTPLSIASSSATACAIFPNLAAAVREIERVTRPGGLLVSLDFFLPANPLAAPLCIWPISTRRAYFWGLLLHGRPRVYTYIPDSLRSFVSIDDFSALLGRAGYGRVDARSFMLGGIGLHWAAKESIRRIRYGGFGMKERLGPSDYRFIAVCLVLLRRSHLVFRPQFLPRLSRGLHRFPRQPRGRAHAGRAISLPARAINLEGYREALPLQLRRRRQDFPGARSRPGTGQPPDGHARPPVALVLSLVPAAAEGRIPRRRHARAASSPASSTRLPEDAARPAPPPPQARALAEDFLRDAHAPRSRRRSISWRSNETARPHRTDRAFTWKERDFNLHDATYRVEVTMLGNEVGGYREYLKVPEQWTARLPAPALEERHGRRPSIRPCWWRCWSGMLVMIVMRVRAPGRALAARGGGRRGRHGAARSCASLNQFPLAEFGYPTTDSYGSFVSRQLLQALLAALAAGGLLFVIDGRRRAALPRGLSAARSRWATCSARAACAPSASSWAPSWASR